MGGTTHVEEFSSEAEAVTEMCDELTATPIPHLSVPMSGGEAVNQE